MYSRNRSNPACYDFSTSARHATSHTRVVQPDGNPTKTKSYLKIPFSFKYPGRDSRRERANSGQKLNFPDQTRAFLAAARPKVEIVVGLPVANFMTCTTLSHTVQALSVTMRQTRYFRLCSVSPSRHSHAMLQARSPLVPAAAQLYLWPSHQYSWAPRQRAGAHRSGGR